MIFSRQVYGKLANEGLENLADSGVARYKIQDVEPNLRLVVPAAENYQFTLAPSATYTVVLPQDYVNTSYLCAYFETTGKLKVTVTKPDTSTSVVLVNGAASPKLGLYSFNQKVTSIVLSNPSAATITVRYMVATQPNLAAAESYRGGYFTYGVYTAQ